MVLRPLRLFPSRELRRVEFSHVCDGSLDILAGAHAPSDNAIWQGYGPQLRSEVELGITH